MQNECTMYVIKKITLHNTESTVLLRKKVKGKNREKQLLRFEKISIYVDITNGHSANI